MLKPMSMVVGLLWSSIALGNIDEAIRKAADRVGVPYKLLRAVCKKESNLKADAFRANDGPTGHAYGLCQIHLPTASWLGFTGKCEDIDYTDKSNRTYTKCNLFGPYTNAYWAGMYLRYQLNRYPKTRHAVGAYNAGTAYICSTGTTKSGKSCEIGKLVNKNYVDHVMEMYLAEVYVVGEL